MKNQETPWQPLYSQARAGVTELCVSGIIAVVTVDDNIAESEAAGDASLFAGQKLLLEAGDVDYQLWTRSLLKPFQLASHFRILRQSHPALKPQHFALMSSSHNCEDVHLGLLAEIMEIGHVGPESLLCPPALPGDPCAREFFRFEGRTPSSLYHNCSGKHFSYLMSLQAQGLPNDDYIAFDNPEHKRLERLLSELLHRPPETFARTTDGCQLPNYALSIKEIATLYQRLAQFAGRLLADGKELDQIAFPQSEPRYVAGPEELGFIGTLMCRFPQILGGSNRLDTRLMSGEFTAGSALRFLAKDGADGLLAISVLPTEKYKDGLGIVIKLASGYDIRNMETIASEIFAKLDLPAVPLETGSQYNLRTDHLKTTFSFNCKRTGDG